MAEFTRQMPGLAFAGINPPVVDETNLHGVRDIHFEFGAPRRVLVEAEGGRGPVDTVDVDAAPPSLLRSIASDRN